MTALIRRLHIWAGLIVFSQFVVYGIAGLVATLQPSLERPKTAHAISRIAFQAQPGESDKQIADRAYEVLKPDLARPMPEWALRRSPEGKLILDFYNINGIYRTTVEPAHLRVEHIRNSFPLFLEDIHAASSSTDVGGMMQAWGMWNEAGIWALLFFCISGLYLWLATRPSWKWAWVSLGASCAIFAAFWVVFR